jgi:hypothetical protein
VAERSGDTAFARSAASESGVALRFPPQSKTVHGRKARSRIIGSSILPRNRPFVVPALAGPARMAPTARERLKPGLQAVRGRKTRTKSGTVSFRSGCGWSGRPSRAPGYNELLIAGAARLALPNKVV